jgi:hypothetical protein
MLTQGTFITPAGQGPVTDLRQRCGDRYRVSQDAAADSLADPWTLTIPCQRGTIYPFGGALLAVDVDYHPGAARQMAALPGVRVHQDGGWGGEMTFTFPVDLFEAVAAIVRPRRRRRLSREHNAKLQAAGACHRYGTKCNLEARFLALSPQAG